MQTRTRILVSAAPWCAGLAFVAALASADQTDTQLADIVVTATKRAEGVQSVPLSITALSADDLKAREITSFIDYATQVPNLSFGYTGAGVATARSIAIRGIQGNGVTGFYIDDTPVPDSIDPRIVGIDHIEVLRGPQGTLYGARSMGGTVRLLTDQPNSDAVSGFVHASGSDTDHTVKPNYAIDGSVNLPISDVAALKVVGFRDSDAGWFTRTYPNPGNPNAVVTDSDIAHSNIEGGSIAFAIRPSDTITITPRVLYQETNTNGFPFADVNLPASGPAKLVPASLVQTRPLDVPEGGTDIWTLYSLTVNALVAGGTITSSTSYFDRVTNETEDSTRFISAIFGTPPLSAPISMNTRDESVIEELRYSSTWQSAFQLVSGLYYSQTQSVLVFPPAFVPGINAALGGALGSDEQYYARTDSLVKEPAIFAEGSYQFTRDLKLITGARFYRITTRGSDTQNGFAVGGPSGDASTTTTDSGINPKVELEYQPVVNAMVYASAARGFRPGGISPAVPSAPTLGCGQDLQKIGVTDDQTRRYGADSLWSYEIGSKSSWLDKRITLDGAIYDIRWKNIQQLVQLSCGFSFTGNAGAAESKGAELEARAKLTRDFTFGLGLGYEHAVITAAGPDSPQVAGDPVYQVPNWTANSQLSYTHSLIAGADWTGSVSYAYVGNSRSANNDPLNPRLRPWYQLIDARWGLDWRRYEFALFGKNLTNTLANLSDSVSIAAEDPGHPRVVTNQPRTLGFDIKVKF